MVCEAPGDEAGASVSCGDDIDRNGRADTLIGAPGSGTDGAANPVAGADLASADGAVDSLIDRGMVAQQPSSRKFIDEFDGTHAGPVVSQACEVNGDAVPDVHLDTTGTTGGTGSANVVPRLMERTLPMAYGLPGCVEWNGTGPRGPDFPDEPRLAPSLAASVSGRRGADLWRASV